jgi:hypothetical protein
VHASTCSIHTHVLSESSHAVPEAHVNLIRTFWKQRINFVQLSLSAEKSSHTSINKILKKQETLILLINFLIITAYVDQKH